MGVFTKNRMQRDLRDEPAPLKEAQSHAWMSGWPCGRSPDFDLYRLPLELVDIRQAGILITLALPTCAYRPGVQVRMMIWHR